MMTVRSSSVTPAVSRTAFTQPTVSQAIADDRAHEVHQDHTHAPLECELGDIYAAIVIAVPFAFLVKTLWS